MSSFEDLGFQLLTSGQGDKTGADDAYAFSPLSLGVVFVSLIGAGSLLGYALSSRSRASDRVPELILREQQNSAKLDADAKRVDEAYDEMKWRRQAIAENREELERNLNAIYRTRRGGPSNLLIDLRGNEPVSVSIDEYGNYSTMTRDEHGTMYLEYKDLADLLDAIKLYKSWGNDALVRLRWERDLGPKTAKDLGAKGFTPKLGSTSMVVDVPARSPVVLEPNMRLGTQYESRPEIVVKAPGVPEHETSQWNVDDELEIYQKGGSEALAAHLQRIRDKQAALEE